MKSTVKIAARVGGLMHARKPVEACHLQGSSNPSPGQCGGPARAGREARRPASNRQVEPTMLSRTGRTFSSKAPSKTTLTTPKETWPRLRQPEECLGHGAGCAGHASGLHHHGERALRPWEPQPDGERSHRCRRAGCATGPCRLLSAGPLWQARRPPRPRSRWPTNTNAGRTGPQRPG